MPGSTYPTRPLVTNSRDTDFDCAKKDCVERRSAVTFPQGCVIHLLPLRSELSADPRKSRVAPRASYPSIQQQSMEEKKGQEASQSEERVWE